MLKKQTRGIGKMKMNTMLNIKLANHIDGIDRWLPEDKEVVLEIKNQSIKRMIFNFLKSSKLFNVKKYGRISIMVKEVK